MSNLTATFVELVRRAQAGLSHVVNQYCPICGKTTKFVLHSEQGNVERYSCEGCGVLQVFTVR